MDKKDDKPKAESKSLVSDVSSQLAALMLKKAYERGEIIEIPSLGIKIQKAEIAPEASPVAWW